MALTPKQNRFIAEYLVDANATQAAVRAQYAFPELRLGFYVYFLVDPRNGEIFYVGKGCGKRVDVHAQRAGRSLANNPRKDARILEIHGCGFAISTVLLEVGLAEPQALDLEREVIAAIGKERLTNHASGIKSDEEQARLMLRRLKPFDAWVAEMHPDALGIECYHAVVKGLTMVASGYDRKYKHLIDSSPRGQWPTPHIQRIIDG